MNRSAQSTILEDGTVQSYFAQMEEEESLKGEIEGIPKFPKTKQPTLYYEAYDNQNPKAVQVLFGSELKKLEKSCCSTNAKISRAKTS
jgi:hypothetical protein